MFSKAWDKKGLTPKKAHELPLRKPNLAKELGKHAPKAEQAPETGYNGQFGGVK